MNCPVCKKYFNKKDKCVDHINAYHSDVLEEKQLDACQLLYASTHNGLLGAPCMCGCGKLTEWNYKTGKPYKVSSDPECRKRLYAKAESNMQKARGVTVHSLLQDMEHQKDMQRHRPTYGQYKFSDGGVVEFLSSLEQNFLKFCDLVMEFTSNMFAPCPENFTYYDPETNSERTYIPDYYLPDYNLIVEIKDGGKKHNTNPAYVKETGYKVKLKDQVMQTQTKYNFIRISGANYGPFVETLYQIVHEQRPAKNQSKSKKNLVVITESACKDLVSETGDTEVSTTEGIAGLSSDYYLLVKMGNSGSLCMVAITRKSVLDTWYVYDTADNTIVEKHVNDPYFDTIGTAQMYRYLPNDRRHICYAYNSIAALANSTEPTKSSIFEVLFDQGVCFDNGTIANNDMRRMHFTKVNSDQVIQEAVTYVRSVLPD